MANKVRPFKVNPKEILANDTDIVQALVQTGNGQYDNYYIKEYSIDPYMSLEDIHKSLKKQYDNIKLITVIIEGPLSGRIYLWGNYGDGYWYETGETCGYA